MTSRLGVKPLPFRPKYLACVHLILRNQPFRPLLASRVGAHLRTEVDAESLYRAVAQVVADFGKTFSCAIDRAD
jgi:hypothetical protein